MAEDITATLGISIEPIDVVQAQVAALKSSAPPAQQSNLADPVVLAERIVKHLFNYLSSFEMRVGPQTVVPLGVIQKCIYFERQQPGSMLCAQHSLNNLLQQSGFSAPDLASIAAHLDEEERAVTEPNPGRSNPRSRNMDDTGFFSIQVLESALKIYDLKLQPGFILNLEQHWYALRRFGQLGHNFHWFNLNSFETEPKWISTTFLGMTLQQAEDEGYSVFVVKALDPLGDNAQDPLPCGADDIAVTIPPQTSNPNISNISNLAMQDLGLDLDDDPELQMALQASLQGARDTDAFRSAAVEEDDDAPLPDVAFEAFRQSVARQKNSIMHARREQEEALRQIREEEVASGSRRRTAGEDEEEELLRRALEESKENARVDAATGGNPALMMSSTMQHVFGRPDRHIPAPSAMPSPTKPRVQPSSSRHYDDEDEELQAALKASLETVPLDFKLPEPAKMPSRSISPTKGSTSSVPLFSTGSPLKQSLTIPARKEEEEEEDSDDDDDEEMVSAPSSPKEEEKPMSMEEMRKMRLARFGGQ
ncbi:hypothetical protein FRB90_005390 [Tulasnella sp. 427]|nr:hypothetical protein FRB90_005390 [Tulasnella sp. 427]